MVSMRRFQHGRREHGEHSAVSAWQRRLLEEITFTYGEHSAVSAWQRRLLEEITFMYGEHSAVSAWQSPLARKGTPERHAQTRTTHMQGETVGPHRDGYRGTSPISLPVFTVTFLPVFTVTWLAVASTAVAVQVSVSLVLSSSYFLSTSPPELEWERVPYGYRLLVNGFLRLFVRARRNSYVH